MSKDIFSINENEMSELLNIGGINNNQENLTIYQNCIDEQIGVLKDLTNKDIRLKNFDVNPFDNRHLKDYSNSNFLIIKGYCEQKQNLFFLFKYKTAVQLVNLISGMKNIIIDDLGRETLKELFHRIFKATIETLYNENIEDIKITFHENETMPSIDKKNYPIIDTNLKIIGDFHDLEELSFIQFLPKEFKKLGEEKQMNNNDDGLKKAVFSDFGNNHASEENNIEISENEEKNINMILDIPMELTVELGRTQKKIGEIVKFSEGSIIELDRIAGESIDIYVNGKNFAKGEVVVINENFAIRITEIIDIKDRLKIYES